MRSNAATSTSSISAGAHALSDQELLARIQSLSRTEREATAELVAHLAVLEMRPNAHRAEGYGSLFAYCTEALRLSEDAACNRIDAARLSRSFPLILDLLAEGSVTLTAIRMLKPHLTAENHVAVLGRAAHRRKEEIQALIAELAPKPDIASSVRKLPVTTDRRATDAGALPGLQFPLGTEQQTEPTAPRAPLPEPEAPASTAPVPEWTPAPAAPRAVIQPLSAHRYRVQFTIGEESRERLRQLQGLLCREVPSADLGVIVERALELLLEEVKKDKLGAPGRHGRCERRKDGSTRNYETRIRPGTDFHSRHLPNDVRQTVWSRDSGQCAFVSETGRRCGERSFLEFHHIQPHALKGPATVGNISLRCRGHNQYEAEMVFGPRICSDRPPR